MNHAKKYFSVFILLLTLVVQAAFPQSAFAAGTVGTGTPGSCTPAALDTALGGGGAVNFNCGGAPVTIVVTGTKTIASNTQIDGGGLITISGGNTKQIFSVQSGATLTLTGITLANGNSGALQGGAISIAIGGTATITTSTFLNNTSSFDSVAAGIPGGAGAIYNAGALNISGSTFSGNTATGPGGDGGAILSNGSVTISNSTFYGNSAVTDGTGGTGGAIRIDGGAGSNSITNVTFSNNANDASWGTVDITNINVTLSHSILANSVSGFDCTLRGSGALTSTNNLIENDSAAFTCSPASTLDPKLGALQNNGGPTQTMAIPADSPAYNYAATCPFATDQRGVSRPQPTGGNCDLGAYELDNTLPTVTINQAAGQADPAVSSPITFDVVFSEAVTGFIGSDVTLGGTAGATTASVTGSGATYTVSVSGMTGDGTVTASLAAGVATDLSGNGNSASTTTDNTVTYDVTNPTVTINQAAGQADPTKASTINFTVVFSETVSGFATGDVTLSGTAGATTATVTEIAPNNGTTFNVAVSGMTQDGTVIATVPAGAATDSMANGNSVSTSTDNVVTYGTPKPTFADVPTSHPYYNDIEILYANGLTAGCGTSPLRFCPDQTMNRGEAAVFMLRGNLGSSFAPDAATHIFKDDWTKGTWAEPWAEGMYKKGMSAGCSSSPLKYCPWEQIPREQAVIFALRLKYGMNYIPPAATGTMFADMTNPSYFATSWAEQAYKDGLIASCGTSGGKPMFCPKNLVSRGLAAQMIVRAKNLTMP